MRSVAAVNRDELIKLQRCWHKRADGAVPYWEIFGFSPASDDESAKFSRALHPLAELLKQPCLFLLGQGGAGKTAEFYSHLTAERLPAETVIAFEARQLDEAGAAGIFSGPEWLTALDAGKPIRLVFDSVDEALIGRGNFLDALKRQLAVAKISADKSDLSLSVVLTSRLEWDEKMASEIAAIWSASSAGCTYQLAPLSFADALALVADRFKLAGCARNPRDLAEEWTRAVMKEYACWPRTLVWLADEFAEKGVISSTLTDLHARRCSRQFEDADRSGRLLDKLTPERIAQMNEATRLLATAAIATGAQRFVVGRPTQGGELDVAALASAVAKWPDVAALPPNAEAFQFAMKHGDLFALTGDAWVFQEQSDAEFLAAQRLAKLPVEQLAGFFGSQTANGWQVFQQHYVTAAMTAVASVEFRKWLLENDPLVLLRADAAALPEADRKEIVAALLDLIESGRAPDAHDYESRLQTLKHGGLAVQLRPWITDTRRRSEAREMALRIAAVCADETLAKELGEDIWQLANGPEAETLSWLPLAISATGVHWPKDRLMQIATGQLSPGRHWNTRGAALDALFHRNRSEAERGKLSEVVTSLVRNPTGVWSSYDSFLRECHEHLRTDDADEICVVLIELRDWRGVLDDLSPLHKLALATLKAAAGKIAEARVCSALVEWWFDAMQRHDGHIPGQHHTCPLADIALDDPGRRRALLSAMLKHSTTAKLNDFSLHELPVQTDDWPWLLERLPKLSGDEAKLAARLIAWRAHNRSLREDNLTALNVAYAASPDLRALLPPSPDGDIHAAMSRIEDENERRWAAESANVKRRMKKEQKYDVVAEFARALDGVVKGDARWWPWLIEAASEPEPHGSVRVWELSQPEELPGWKNIPADAAASVRKAARDYLIHHPTELAARKQSHLGMEATRHALCFLRDELRNDPELRAAFRREWVCILLRHLHPDRAPLPEVLATLHEIDPRSLLDCIREQLNYEWDEKGWIHADHLDALFPAVKDTFIEVLSRSPLQPEPYRTGICWLMRHDRAAAAELALRRCDEHAQLPSSDARCVAIGTALLAFPEHWQRVWPYIAADSAEGLKCLAWVAGASERNGWQNKLFGDEAKHADFIAMLYGWLLKFLPPEPERRGTYTPTGIDDCRDLERRCHQTLREAGLDGHLSRAFTFAGVGDRVWTRSAVKKAEHNAHAQKWQPWQPAHFIEWLATDGGTRITDDATLHRAVAASLRRFEQAWKDNKVQHVCLWNLDAKIPRREKFLSDALKLHLQHDLCRRIVPKGTSAFVFREPEWFTGEKTDLLIQAALPDGKEASVVVEVKLCDHAEVETAMETQLAARYLREKGNTHGIYFVGWFGCDAWPPKPKPFQKITLAKARSQLVKQAIRLSSDGLIITAIVSPCPLPTKLAARNPKTKPPMRRPTPTRR